MNKLYLSEKHKLKAPKNSKKAFLAWYFDNHQPRTYTKNKQLQCHVGKKRTLADLTALVNGVFKTKTTHRQMLDILIILTKEQKVKHVSCDYVDDITWFNVEFSSYGRTGYIGTDQIYKIEKKYKI